MKQPTVYFITPMYNVEEFLKETAESVLQQSYQHFQWILADDASTDDSKRIATELEKTDARIIVLSNPTNGGAYKAGNLALDYAMKHANDEDYIYILDSDDLLINGGLEAQVQHMQNNPNIDILGGALQCFGTSKKTLNSFETDNDLIHMGLLYNSTTAHPATLIRKHALEKIRYEKTHYYAHDYHFFTRLAFDTNAVFSSYQKTVYMYRMHASQTSTKDNSKQRESADGVRKEVLQRMGVTNTSVIETHLHLCHKLPHRITTANHWSDYYTTLVKCNNKTQVMPVDKFAKFLTDKTVRNMYRMGKNAKIIYKQMPEEFKKHITLSQKIKLYLSALRPLKK